MHGEDVLGPSDMAEPFNHASLTYESRLGVALVKILEISHLEWQVLFWSSSYHDLEIFHLEWRELFRSSF